MQVFIVIDHWHIDILNAENSLNKALWALFALNISHWKYLSN